MTLVSIVGSANSTTTSTSSHHHKITTTTSTTTTRYNSHHLHSNNNKRYYRHHLKRNSKGSSIFRNPFVVFVITFSILGSLRFVKKEKVARQHHILPSINLNNTSNQNDVMINHQMMMEYRMIEEVVADTSNYDMKGIRSYRKYVAVMSNENMMDEYTIPTTVTTLDDATTRYVTVSQWMQTIVDTINITTTTPSSSNNIGNQIRAIELLNEIIRTSPYTALFWETPAVASYHQYQTQRFEFVLVNAPELHDMTVFDNKNQHDIHPFIKPLASQQSKNHNPYAASFPNLGGDAVLIVPKYIANDDDNNNNNNSMVDTVSPNAASGGIVAPHTARYAHLANFIRYHHSLPSSTSAETNQQHRHMVYAVWQMVAHTYDAQIRTRFASDPQDEIGSSNQRREGLDTKNSQPQRQGLWLSTSGLGVLYLHFRIDTVPKYYSHVPYKTIHN
jgi:hypothetical protein